MIKDFSYEFINSSKITSSEVLSSLFNKDKKLEVVVKLNNKEQEEIKTYYLDIYHSLNLCNYDKYSLDLVKLELEEKENILIIKGQIEIKEIRSEEENFSYDPFKDTLLKSFISFKRNKQDVDVITTLQEDKIVSYQDLKLNEDDLIELSNNKQEEINLPIEESKQVEKTPLMKDKYVSSFFYYRIKKDENLSDILKRYAISYEEFIKYNPTKEYYENSLIRIKKHEK